MKHCGQLLGLEIKRQRPVKKDLCSHLGILPQNLGRELEKASLDSQLLEKFCEYLKIDPMLFFDYSPHSISGISVGSIDQSVGIGSAEVVFSESEMTLVSQLLAEKERTISMLTNQIATLQKLVEVLSSNDGICGQIVDNK